MLCPNGPSCPPMEQTCSSSSEYSMQSNAGFWNIYNIDESDFELFRQASNTSVYPSSSYSSSFPSSFTSSPFEPSYDYSPAAMCSSDVNQPLPTQCFAPVQASWPGATAQVPMMEEPSLTPDTQVPLLDATKPAKPYTCACGKAFTRPADLKRHESTVHRPVYQDCPVEECLRKDSNGFPRRDHLIEHLRSYHHWNVPKRRVVKRGAKAT
ncbi:hypothetical protein BDV59DRAFT_156350 [Aspergillus ambiguus]|uniref:uncharacterized protein n=1 Tax=Aspergillus ambiguus TaxID=176160 RepID=UPI003CCDF142